MFSNKKSQAEWKSFLYRLFNLLETLICESLQALISSGNAYR